jgi:hypothetical protein
MLVTGAILAVALAVVGCAAWWGLRARSLPAALSLGVAIGAMWITSMAIVWWRHDEPPSRSQLVQSIGSLAWPATGASPAPRPSSAAAAPGVQAASVESLVSGLEARLAAQPDDAQGWVLLAQSYAYTSDEEAVERAVQHAVALGVDEAALRERVANAKRSAPVRDGVEHAIGAPRQ